MMSAQEFDEAKSRCDEEAQRYFGISVSELLKRVKALEARNSELLDALKKLQGMGLGANAYAICTKAIEGRK
jgi:hypothetical protein